MTIIPAGAKGDEKLKVPTVQSTLQLVPKMKADTPKVATAAGPTQPSHEHEMPLETQQAKEAQPEEQTTSAATPETADAHADLKTITVDSTGEPAAAQTQQDPDATQQASLEQPQPEEQTTSAAPRARGEPMEENEGQCEDPRLKLNTVSFSFVRNMHWSNK